MRRSSWLAAGLALVLPALCLAVAPGVAQAAGSVTAGASADSFGSAANPTTVNGARVYAITDDAPIVSWVKFTVTGIPSGAPVTSATLTLMGTSDAQTTQTLSVRTLPNTWDEATTYSTRPTPGAVVGTGSLGTNLAMNVKVPITGNGTYSLAITRTTAGGNNIFGTRENATATKRPKLVVNYGDTTTPPASTVNPSNLWDGPQQVDNFTAAHPELKPIADTPQAMWALPETSSSTITGWKNAAAGKTLTLVLYAVPNRDGGGYSAGGFPDRASYLNYVTSVKNAIGTAPTILVLEPDALGHANGFDATAKAERIETIRQAVNILAGQPNLEVYIDASMWVGTADQANLLQAADVAKVSGFALNTSGHNAQQTVYDYGNSVVALLNGKGLSGKKFVVDSSRNGNGPLTDADRPLADPWLDSGQGWANPPNRKVGQAPGPVSGQANVRATLWVKNPGESDGSFPSLSQSSFYGESAPSAGTFWVPAARNLLGLTPKP